MGLVSTPNRFDVFLVGLDPTRGSEIQKPRPCTVVSPNEMNRSLRTVVVAPMTTGGKEYPTRIPVNFLGQAGRVALDQLRTVDRTRLTRLLGRLSMEEERAILQSLAELFAP